MNRKKAVRIGADLAVIALVAAVIAMWWLLGSRPSFTPEMALERAQRWYGSFFTGQVYELPGEAGGAVWLGRMGEEYGLVAAEKEGLLYRGTAVNTIRDLEGQRRGVYYTRMDNGWYSIITVPYSKILGGLQSVLWPLILMFGISFLVMTALALREYRLESRARRANETAQVLGNTYYALYRVDYERETYEMIKGSDYVRQRIPSTGPYTDLLRTAGEVIEADAFRDFTESFSCENIRELVQQRVRDFGGEFLRRFGVGSAKELPEMDFSQREEIRTEVEEELKLKLDVDGRILEAGEENGSRENGQEEQGHEMQ